MSRAAPKAVPHSGRFASVPAAGGTPKGLTLSSRGQGHALCARRPRIVSLPYITDPEGVERFGPARMGVGPVREPPLLSLVPIRRFHLRLLTVFPLRGTGQRPNLFAPHWSNQWLTSGTVEHPRGAESENRRDHKADKAPIEGL
jgi:hypothetical protein